MKTHDLPRPPRPARSQFPFASLPSSTPTLARVDDWRYPAPSKNRVTLAVGVLVAAGMHAAMFYAFPTEPARALARLAPRPEGTIQIVMPPLPPEEIEDRPRELADAAESAIAVPQLADVPSTVALSDFTQTLDLRPRAEVDVAALKSMTIPMLRGRGGSGFAAQGTIFNLAQLDRVPQAIAQPMPSFPRNVRIPGLEQVIVVVEFIVDAEGRVIEPRVTSSNALEFNNAALAGVLRWKFRPGMLSGKRVATRMEVPLKFDLNARE